VASCVIEVRDARVVNYNGGYESYLYAVNREIDEGERAAAAARGKLSPRPGGPAPAGSPATSRRNERDIRKEISTIEKTIARLDTQKKQLSTQLLQATNAQEALRLHTELESLQQPLAEAEERWCQLQEELG
ncbi:MAG: ABC transporter C-terminal domain-containing protein, partial [Planctomycetaceae bacterium]